MIRRAQRVIFGLLILCVGYAAAVLHSTYAISRMDPGGALEGGMCRILAVVPDTGSADGGSLRQELDLAGRTYGAFVELYETATASEQHKVLQIAVDSGADGVLLYPMEEVGYTAAVDACAEANIPVVVISQRLENARFATYIGAAVNSERMAALSCVSATGGTGRLLIVDHLNSGGQFCTEAALLVPLETLPPEEAQEAPPLEIPALKTKIADLVHTPFEGYRVQSVTLLDEPQASSYSLYTEIYRLLDAEKPDAVFSYNGDVTNVVTACLSNAHNLLNIYTVGYGGLREGAELLRSGMLNGLVLQNDIYAASLAVRYLVELDKGAPMPPAVDSGIVLITEDNMDRILGENEM